MKWTPRDVCMLVLVVGVLLVLGTVTVLDFYLAQVMNQMPDQDVIHLLEKALIGTIGLIGGYFMSRQESRDEGQ